MSTSRRTFLRVTAVSTAAWVLGCGRPAVTGGDDAGTAPDGGVDGGVADAGVPDAGTPDAGVPDTPLDLPEDAAVFPFAVASGDVEADRAVLWTKVVGGVSLRLRVWRMEGDAFARRVVDAPVTLEDGGYVHVDADGLEAGARYRYGFLVEDGQGGFSGRSPIGRFRTALAPGVKAPLVFGAMSCSKQGFTPAPLQRASEREDLDLFLFLGDTTYADGADTLAEYRVKWAENLARPEFRALLPSTSLLATWDDHEITNNLNPETVSQTKLANARAAFFETLPVRRNPQAPDRVWRSVRWGDTAEFFVLDCRTERRPSTLLPGRTHLFLSRAQLDWLKAGLKASPAAFKVVLTSVPISHFGFSAFNTDGWVVYGQQRDELLSWVDVEGITGVLWIAGDHHFASVGTVSASGAGATQLEVLAGPAAQGGNVLHELLKPPRWPFSDDTNNYLAVHLDPATVSARLVFHDGAGAVLYDGAHALG